MASNGKAAGQAAAPAFPILGLLGLIFVTLKLCGVIGWSWWWVTIPFWGPFALAIGIVLLIAFGIAVVAVIKAVVAEVRKRRAAKNAE